MKRMIPSECLKLGCNSSSTRCSIVNNLILERPVCMGGGKRSSNLELFRIVCMLLIVAHHLVVHSGLTGEFGSMTLHPDDPKTYFLLLFGMWGKVGINCFLLITGYFMCLQHITKRKFFKLFIWLYTYKLALFSIFYLFGKEEITLKRVFEIIMPFWDVTNSFVPCYLLFWLTIPFLNILIHGMSRKQYERLLLLLLGVYTIWGSNPYVLVNYNYIIWFGIIYLLGAYLRLYPLTTISKNSYGLLTAFFIALSYLSVIFLHTTHHTPYLFVADSNKILSVAVSVFSFLWFKSINIGYLPVVNYVAASTFGVLLIHDGSQAMRHWLWNEFIPIDSLYNNLPLFQLILYCIAIVCFVYTVCTLIDIIRINIFEKPLFTWYDRKYKI